MAHDPKVVLILAYHYPPASNGGMRRSESFVRHLPAFGWRARVLTTNLFGPATGDDVTQTGEPLGIARRLGALVRRLRRRPEPPSSAITSASARRVNRLAQRWMIPDVQVAWALFALPRAFGLARRADVILSTSPPPSAHLLGLALHRLTRRPLVLDLRDPWTIEPMNEHLRRGGFRLSLERWLEGRCFRAARTIILNTPQAHARYQALYPQHAHKMQVITNGYDAEAMAAAAADTSSPAPWRPIPDGAFVISHVGAFHRRLSDDPTPGVFLEALRTLRERGTIGESDVRVVFAGGVHRRTRQRVHALGLHKQIDMPGRLSYHDALRLMYRSDALLLYDPEEDGSIYVRGKLYEYLATRKPILGIVPEGANRDLLLSAGIRSIAAPSDLEAVTSALACVLRREAFGPAPDFIIDRYERTNLARALADVLSAAVAKT